MRIRGWALTDVGRKREHNEDSFLCDDGLGLYVVADGMGGHLGGERASRMAIETVSKAVGAAHRDGRLDAPDAMGGKATHPAAAVIKAATQEADAAIFETAKTNPELAGMGTTLTGLLFHGSHLCVCHVGDSRAFLYRDGKARQLTEDHSWIQEQVRAGLLTPEEAKESRFKNIITRSVGFEPNVEPDVQVLAVQTGDCYLLCSDGLSNYLGADEIAQILTSHFYRDAARVFVETANERGGEDNITCVVVYVGNRT